MGLGARTKKFLRKLSGQDSGNQQDEVKQLQPVALAGASKRAHARSELCNSFAVTVPHEELEGYRQKAVSDGSANVQFAECETCTRNFVVGASRFATFCSVDCKSAALFTRSQHTLARA